MEFCKIYMNSVALAANFFFSIIFPILLPYAIHTIQREVINFLWFFRQLVDPYYLIWYIQIVTNYF